MVLLRKTGYPPRQLSGPSSTAAFLISWNARNIELKKETFRNFLGKFRFHVRFNVKNSLGTVKISLVWEEYVAPSFTRKTFSTEKFIIFFSREYYFHISYIGLSAVVERVLWNRVCPIFRPSVRLSTSFLWIWSLIPSKFWHDVRNPNEIVPDMPGFSKTKTFTPKQKWAKNRVFFKIFSWI